MSFDTEGQSVTAIFSVPLFVLNVSKTGSGTGTVYGPGITCGSDCSESLQPNSSVSMSVDVGIGSTFGGWSVSGSSPGTCTGTTNPCGFTLTANTTVTATFNALPAPNLVATGLTIVDPTIVNTPIRFRGSASNIGQENAGNFYGRFCINNTSCLTSTVGIIGTDIGPLGPLAAGASLSSPVTSDQWTPSATGNFTITWCVDVTNLVNEGAYEGTASNCQTQTFTVIPPPPDYVVDPLPDPVPNPGTPGSSMSFNATIRNVGGAVPAGGGSITLVQQTSGVSGTNVLSFSVPWPSPTQTGNLLLLAVTVNWPSTSVGTITAPPGWVPIGTQVNRVDVLAVSTSLFYRENAPAQSGNVTTTSSIAGSYYVSLAEYRGIATSSSLDRSAQASGSGTTASTGITATTTQADELWIGVIGTPAADHCSPTNGFVAVNVPFDGAGRQGFFQRITTATGSAGTSVTLGWPTGSDNNCSLGSIIRPWVGKVATFRRGTAAPNISSARARIDLNNDGWGVGTDITLTPNQDVPALSANGTANVSWSWTPGSGDAGTHGFEVCADVTDVIDESSDYVNDSNPGNNCNYSTFSVSQPLSVSLDPVAAGSPPLTVQLTARASGVSPPLDYFFWWNCSLTSADLAAAQTACGSLPTTDAGGDTTCATNAFGAFCNDVPTLTEIAPAYTYDTSGTYSAKVIARQGVLSAEARTPVTVGAGLKPNLTARNLQRNIANPNEGSSVSFTGEVVNQ